MGNTLPPPTCRDTSYYMGIIIEGMNTLCLCSRGDLQSRGGSDRLVLHHVQKAVKMSTPRLDQFAFHVHVSGDSFSPSKRRKT